MFAPTRGRGKRKTSCSRRHARVEPIIFPPRMSHHVAGSSVCSRAGVCVAWRSFDDRPSNLFALLS